MYVYMYVALSHLSCCFYACIFRRPACPNPFLQIIPQLAVDTVRGLPPFLLLHGEADLTVPFSSSVHFADALLSADSQAKVHIHVLPAPADHMSPIVDLMTSQNSHQHICDLIHAFVTHVCVNVEDE